MSLPAHYELAVSYAGASLIEGFTFFNNSDPNDGAVSYLAREGVEELGLYGFDPITDAVTIRVDSDNVYDPGQGRPSVRIESAESFDHGLFIGDFAHMPPSQCGVWPAFWALGAQWPADGEIDIIEGAGMAHRNLMSAHSIEGCTLTGLADGSDYTGTLQRSDCGPGDFGTGCSYAAPAGSAGSYGDTFNAVGGGVYAMEWTSDLIRIWHFGRHNIPADIGARAPTPSTWGPPVAAFGGSTCEPDKYFRQLRLVLSIDLCGAYANADWARDPICRSRADTCADFVADNPAAFSETFWQVNYIDAYKSVIATESAAAQPQPTTTTTRTSQATVTQTIRPVKGRMPMQQDIAIISLSTSSSSTSTPSTASSSTSTPSTASSSPTLSFTAPSSTTSSSAASSSGSSTTTWTSSSTRTGTGAATGGSSSSTWTSGIPAPTNAAQIGNYSYMGCFESESGFPMFNQAGANTTEMTADSCVALCKPHKFAAVFSETCYCADMLGGDIKALGDVSECDTPCPGNPAEACGGLACVLTDDVGWNHTTPNNGSGGAGGALLSRRAASADILLTVYGLLTEEPNPAPAPGMGGGSPPPQLVTVTSTVVYTTVCPTDSGMLAPTSYVTVIVTECGYGETPSVEMATRVVPCSGCGPQGQSQVTLTVPAAAAVVTVVEMPAAPPSSPSPAVSPSQQAASPTPIPSAVRAAAPGLAPPGVLGVVGTLSLLLGIVLL